MIKCLMSKSKTGTNLQKAREAIAQAHFKKSDSVEANYKVVRGGLKLTHFIS